MCENTTSLKAFKLKNDKRSGKLILTKLLDKQLEKVVLPRDIDIIGADAFKNAKNLKEIVFNEGLSEIKEDAFLGCVALSTVEMPASITAIAEDCFNGCTELTGVVIPASVTFIDEDAFYGCEKLQKVIYLGTAEQWQQIKIVTPNNCLLNATLECKG